MKNYLFDVFDKKKELFHNDTIEPVFSPEYTIEDKIIRQEELHYQSRKIRQMLESLTPRQKEVLYYKYMKTRPIMDGFRKNNVNYWVFREIRSIIPHL